MSARLVPIKMFAYLVLQLYDPKPHPLLAVEDARQKTIALPPFAVGTIRRVVSGAAILRIVFQWTVFVSNAFARILGVKLVEVFCNDQRRWFQQSKSVRTIVISAQPASSTDLANLARPPLEAGFARGSGVVVGRLVFLLEEPTSMKESAFDSCYYRAYFPDLNFLCIPHEGRVSVLYNNIQNKLRGWSKPGDRFAIVRDTSQPGLRCSQAETAPIQDLCNKTGHNDVLIPHLCQEPEAW